MQRSDFIVFLGNRIRFFRKRKRLSLLVLANMCDTSEKHLGQIERGKGNATIELLEKISTNLGVHMHDLLDVSGEQSRERLTLELHTIIAKASDNELKRIYNVVRACIL